MAKVTAIEAKQKLVGMAACPRWPPSIPRQRCPVTITDTSASKLLLVRVQEGKEVIFVY